MRSFYQMCFVAVFALAEPCFAQKLVDPNTDCSRVSRGGGKAPGRAEIKQLECRHKVEAAKVLPRDQAAAITRSSMVAQTLAAAAAHP